MSENDDIFDDGKKSDNNKVTAEDLAIDSLMHSENGRAFIWQQLSSCGVFDSTFNLDPIQSAYNSGNRDAGLRLENRVKQASPEYYLKMLKENI